MISSLDIENYQSVHRASIRLGGLTVVTGATGSGKTALIRALRLLAFNARGTSYIRHGATVARVVAAFPVPGDRPYCSVGIHRGQRGSDKYIIASAVEDGEPEQAEYTKLGGAVPQQVSSLLRLGELNFAGQFDRPFLLDESGGEVAKVLGRLTSVTLIFEAAREGSRRKAEITRDLKRADADVVRLTAEARRFTRLREQIAAAEAAEAALAQATLTEARAVRLRHLSGVLSAAQAHSRAITIPEVPDSTTLDSLLARRYRLADLTEKVRTARHTADLQVRQADSLAEAIAQTERQLHQMLADAGTCPTCGQAIG